MLEGILLGTLDTHLFRTGFYGFSTGYYGFSTGSLRFNNWEQYFQKKNGQYQCGTVKIKS